MAQSIPSEALWEKLSEIGEKLDKASESQKSLVSILKETAGNKPDFVNAKDEIITKIKGEILIFGMSNDSHFDANRQNIGMLNDNITKVFNVVSRIRKQQKESVVLQKEKESCFNFWFLRVRKTTLAIAILGILVFVLTLFCMKQQNDYALLINEYYRQKIEIREMEAVKGK